MAGFSKHIAAILPEVEQEIVKVHCDFWAQAT